jgi:uncharacterized protein YbjT (DUF2867 family)
MKPLILVTGATGYVGGQLLKALLVAGCRVRCLARRPEALQSAETAGAEVVAGDVLDPVSLRTAMAGVHTAFYLLGRAYWYISWPVHRILFPGMLKQIGRVARGGSQVLV